MKRSFCALTLLAALVLSACAVQTAIPAATGAVTPAPITDTDDAASGASDAHSRGVLRALIVDGAETGRLLLAGEGDVAGVYLLDVSGVSVTLDGAAADASVLEDGMRVEIAYRGDLPLTMPAPLDGAETVRAWSRGTAENPGGTTYDLCGLYLQVLSDLWDEDTGLNGGAKYVSVDLSAAPGELSDAAKFAVAWSFAQSHGVEALTLRYDELVEQGYLTDATPEGVSWQAYQWDDGVLFSITADAGEHEGEVYSLPAVFFNAEKWRSPLGAYYFCHCSAFWPEMGTWSEYRVGSEAIS